MRVSFITLLLGVLFLVSCKSKEEPKEEKKDSTEVAEGTPVTVTSASIGAMDETVELTATSTFLVKSYVKANANGYLTAVNTQMGKYVQKGQELFTLKTKESQSLGNTVKDLDPSLHFEGTMHIKAPGSGFVTQLTYRTGDYVQDNEQLATITDTKNFVFLLNLPYELKPYLPLNKNLQLHLPDGTTLKGTIEGAMPTVDMASQTQSYMIKVDTDKSIPENLLAKVYFVKSAKSKIVSLPKEAVLTDEIQSQFWIMKMKDSTTAIKVLVKKGMETKDRVEIVSPVLSPSDKILLTGNYGLPDTAKVKIITN
jgi:multidrug efflux pump subunit AcrA (membrane-fusion protein)